MIFLWAFLLLAAATGSVQSQACSCPCSHEEVVKKTFTDESYRFQNALPPNLSLGTVSTLLSPVLTSVSRLVILEVTIDNVNVNGSNIHIDLSLSTTCNEIKQFNIKVSITATLSLETLNGCAHWSYIKDVLRIEISINGKSLNVASVVLDALLNVIKPLLEGVGKTIVDLLCGKLNYISSELTTSYYLGETECHHEASNIELAAGVITGEILTYANGQSMPWGVVGDNNLAENELHKINVPSSIAISLLQIVVKLVLAKINLAKELLDGKIAVGNYDSSFFAQIHVKGLNDCEFKEDGVYISLEVEANIYSGETIVATGTAVITVIAQTQHYHGYLGLFFSANADIAVDVSVTFQHSSCGCADSITDTLNTLLKLHFNVYLSELNCLLKQLLPLPILSGLPGNNGKCVSKTGYAQCVYTK